MFEHQDSFATNMQRAQQAFRNCLHRHLYEGEELLSRTRTSLKRQCGDLPLVQTETGPFQTATFEAARAWGWLEFVTGVYQLGREHPGTALMYLKRAWRIWQPWERLGTTSEEQNEATRERLRASLWLGEAWARTISDRASRAATTILHTTLLAVDRLQEQALLEETIQQQRSLPLALPGSPAWNPGKQSMPFLCLLLGTQARSGFSPE